MAWVEFSFYSLFIYYSLFQSGVDRHEYPIHFPVDMQSYNASGKQGRSKSFLNSKKNRRHTHLWCSSHSNEKSNNLKIVILLYINPFINECVFFFIFSQILSCQNNRKRPYCYFQQILFSLQMRGIRKIWTNGFHTWFSSCNPYVQIDGKSKKHIWCENSRKICIT